MALTGCELLADPSAARRYLHPVRSHPPPSRIELDLILPVLPLDVVDFQVGRDG